MFRGLKVREYYFDSLQRTIGLKSEGLVCFGVEDFDNQEFIEVSSLAWGEASSFGSEGAFSFRSEVINFAFEAFKKDNFVETKPKDQKSKDKEAQAFEAFLHLISRKEGEDKKEVVVGNNLVVAKVISHVLLS